MAAARKSVEDSDDRARELLTGAYASVEDIRTTMRQLIGALSDSLAALDSSAELDRSPARTGAR